jgi:hypothetical protein
MPPPRLSLSNKQKHDLAVSLGHGNLMVVETRSRRRWRASCECGWNTAKDAPTRATAKEAVLHAAQHLDGVIREHLDNRNGVSPAKLSAPVPMVTNTR